MLRNKDIYSYGSIHTKTTASEDFEYTKGVIWWTIVDLAVVKIGQKCEKCCPRYKKRKVSSSIILGITEGWALLEEEENCKMTFSLTLPIKWRYKKKSSVKHSVDQFTKQTRNHFLKKLVAN